ncbi:adenylosuccinate lyase [Simkania negevensis]|uniref:Adenylosuccinate lyase n=1 Tax=Simkania negevensis (strain ATCC VR-1471 / DSM 27360 / Z) TaxID=331113 RepID=F8L546_SIMNZ|nr:adenylosuccinate lyase [Simkania negevensis]CCB87927.1 adenylosuccinate lyase [Simkania negevensis Z]
MNEYQSPLTVRYASSEMKIIFSPQHKYETWRKLWIALAEAQKELGLKITDEQIAELKKNISKIDFDAVRIFETESRHEVMAHIRAYGAVCPNAKGILHIGATSAYVMDNGDLIQMKEGLELLKGKLIYVIEKLNHLALKNVDTPCLGFTHFQPAQPTTVGKRVALWLQDFVTDFYDLFHLMGTFPFLGVKGATGSQVSYMALFENDQEKVVELDEKVTKKMGFQKAYYVSGQTFPRKQELRILNVLASLASSVHKCATDLRLLSHLNEFEEPFGESQVGSSAMPYKRNPIMAERACALARFVLSLWNNPAYTASLQWLERSLDDSANRRIAIPEAFLAADSLLNLMGNLIEGLKIFPSMMTAHLQEHLPYLAMEHVLAAAVLKGKDRGVVHEKLRQHAFEAGKHKREHGRPSDLLARMTADSEIGLSETELASLFKAEGLTGRSKQQVIEFLKLEVQPLLEQNLSLKPPTLGV